MNLEDEIDSAFVKEISEPGGFVWCKVMCENLIDECRRLRAALRECVAAAGAIIGDPDPELVQAERRVLDAVAAWERAGTAGTVKEFDIAEDNLTDLTEAYVLLLDKRAAEKGKP